MAVACRSIDGADFRTLDALAMSLTWHGVRLDIRAAQAIDQTRNTHQCLDSHGCRQYKQFADNNHKAIVGGQHAQFTSSKFIPFACFAITGFTPIDR